VGNPYANYNNPMTQPQILVPKMPESGQTNQQILMALAEGTGGFTIYNTNDLLSGLGAHRAGGQPVLRARLCAAGNSGGQLPRPEGEAEPRREWK